MRSRLMMILTGAVVFLATACGSTSTGTGGAAGGGPVLWAHPGSLEKLYDLSVSWYNEKHPGHPMTIQKYDNDPYKVKLRESLLEGRTEEPTPDVFFNWGGGSLKSFVDAGKVQDLNAEIAAHPEVKARFLPSSLDSATYGDKIYGLPMNGVQPVNFFYHKELFARAGVAVPQTFDELLAVVGKLRAAGITPITLGGKSKWTDLMYIEYLVDRLAGPQLFESIRNGDTNAWSSPVMLQAARMVQQLVDAGAFQQGFETMSYDDGSTSKQLAGGQAAMELMITAQFPNLIDRAPDLISGDKLGWFPFPTVAGGTGNPRNVVGSPTNYYSIRAGSAASAGAADYLRDVMMSDPYVDWLIDKGEVPPVTGIEQKLAKSPYASWLEFTYASVRDAPHFQLSWDQALSPQDAGVLLDQLDLLFRKNITPEQFTSAMRDKTGKPR